MFQQHTFINEITTGITLHYDLTILREILLSYKNRGMTQDVMRDTLIEIQHTENEEIILDLLDFVEGFCRADLKLYD